MRLPSTRPHLLATLLVLGCSALAAAAQDAKKDFDMSQKLADSDQCASMQYACKAATEDPKKKEYRTACDTARGALLGAGVGYLKTAHDNLDAGKYPVAKRYADYVCKYNEAQFNEAEQIRKEIVQKTQNASATPALQPRPVEQPAQPPKADPSAALYARAKASFDAQNFDDAQNAASQVTNPDLKGLANEIVQKIGQYKSDMAAAQKSEQNKDYDGAIASYRAAQQVDQNGPGNPGAQIQRLEAVARAAQPPNPQPSTQKPSTPQTPVVAQKPPQQAKPAAEDPAVTFARLMDEAGKAEKTGNLQAAARAYDNATHVPGASDAAQAGKLRVQQAINSDPAEQAKTLTQALREFYASKFSDAEDDFGTYLSSPTAKSRGVAHFYLAASRLSRFIIEHPSAKNDATIDNPDVQRLFKEARSDKYVPVEKYVSPIVMRAWQSSN